MTDSNLAGSCSNSARRLFASSNFSEALWYCSSIAFLSCTACLLSELACSSCCVTALCSATIRRFSSTHALISDCCWSFASTSCSFSASKFSLVCCNSAIFFLSAVTWWFCSASTSVCLFSRSSFSWLACFVASRIFSNSFLACFSAWSSCLYSSNSLTISCCSFSRFAECCWACAIRLSYSATIWALFSVASLSFVLVDSSCCCRFSLTCCNSALFFLSAATWLFCSATTSACLLSSWSFCCLACFVASRVFSSSFLACFSAWSSCLNSFSSLTISCCSFSRFAECCCACSILLSYSATICSLFSVASLSFVLVELSCCCKLSSFSACCLFNVLLCPSWSFSSEIFTSNACLVFFKDSKCDSSSLTRSLWVSLIWLSACSTSFFSDLIFSRVACTSPCLVSVSLSCFWSSWIRAALAWISR